MRSFLRLTTVVASLLMTAWAVPVLFLERYNRGEDGGRHAEW